MSLRCLVPVLLTVCLLAAPAASAQDRPEQLRTLSREELDVVKVLNAQERAWNQGNIDAYTSAFKNSKETLFVADHITRGYEQVLFDYKHNYATRQAMGTLTFSELEPHVLDEKFAVIVGRYHVDREKKAGGAADGVFSLVLEKTEQGWKIVVDHTT
jgi:ketosteroid isomerase-like protein